MHSVNHATAWYIKHIGRELAHTGDGRRSRRLLLTPLPSATGCATAAPRCQSGSRPSRRAEPANQCRATKRAPAGCSVSRTELVELLAQAVDQVPDVSPKCWMTTENDWSHLGNCWTSEWPWNAGVKRGTKSASSASEQLIGAPLLSSGAARTRDWFNPSIAHSYNRRSFLKERDRSRPRLRLRLLVLELPSPGWARRSRRRGQGSGGARPRSGRRALTATPFGACCSGQGGRNCLSCFRLG
jgi:hypothetical protein